MYSYKNTDACTYVQTCVQAQSCMRSAAYDQLAVRMYLQKTRTNVYVSIHTYTDVYIYRPVRGHSLV